MKLFNFHPIVIANLETLRGGDNPLSEWLVLAVLLYMKKTPIDFTILKYGGSRTDKEQNQIFKDNPHVTNCDGFIIKSGHQKKLCVDLIPWVNGVPTWDAVHTGAISCSFVTFCRGLGLDVESGGDWDGDGNMNEKFYDPCHFEIKGLL